MMMDRMHAVETENQDLKQEVQNLKKEVKYIRAITPSSNGVLFHTSVFYDMPGLCSVQDLGFELWDANAGHYDVTICVTPWDRSDLKRPVVDIDGVFITRSDDQLEATVWRGMITAAWGDILLDKSISAGVYNNNIDNAAKRVRFDVKHTARANLWSVLLCEAELSWRGKRDDDCEAPGNARVRWDQLPTRSEVNRWAGLIVAHGSERPHFRNEDVLAKIEEIMSEVHW